MKKAFKTFISLLLTASVLFASTGVVIASHICLKKQKSDVSFFESKSCCSKHGKGCSDVPAIKNKCCQFSISYHKLEVNSVTKNSSSFGEISVPVMEAVVSTPELSSFQMILSVADDHPDVLRLIPGSKNFLYSIHLLRI